MKDDWSWAKSMAIRDEAYDKHFFHGVDTDEWDEFIKAHPSADESGDRNEYAEKGFFDSGEDR